jgi:hypothetical protein
MYFQWDTKEDFDSWHNALCLQLGYPEIVNGKIITDSYTRAFAYQGVWIAYVDENYADGLVSIDFDPKLLLSTIL